MTITLYIKQHRDTGPFGSRSTMAMSDAIM